jgi:hypothetical protein
MERIDRLAAGVADKRKGNENIEWKKKETKCSRRLRVDVAAGNDGRLFFSTRRIDRRLGEFVIA